VKLPNWTREPLVHFLVLGAALYVALTWGGSPPDPTSRVISVGPAEKEKIAESFALSMGRSPTDAELDQAIDNFVREEVLYREALRLGLDESDAIVRRRLVSKMDLSASLAAETAEPTDESLRAFLEENAESYAGQDSQRASVSFDQIFFAREASARAAQRGGAGLNSGEATSLPASTESTMMREVETRFGMQFAQGLSQLEPGAAWQGPVQSGFGWHLVRLREREAAELDFEALRGVLANDWRSAQIRERKERGYETLRSAYRIDIDR